MDDDLYPADGSYFVPREPQEQINARKSERAQTIQGAAVLREVISRLEERIRFYETIDAIPKEVRTDQQSFLIAINANTLTRDNLVQEKEYIESLLDTAESKEV